jgi:hypothetical protein
VALRAKYKAAGPIEKDKVGFVVEGSSQKEGIDYERPFFWEDPSVVRLVLYYGHRETVKPAWVTHTAEHIFFQREASLSRESD